MSESSTSHGSARPLEVDHGSRLLTAGHGPRLAAPKGLRLDSQSHRCALITRVALHLGPRGGGEEPRALSPKVKVLERIQSMGICNILLLTRTTSPSMVA